MAEYITKEQALELLDDGDMYARKALTEMKSADVIERSKVDKAIEELQHIKVYEHTATARLVSLPEVLDVLKRNIGE